ncbi:MAG: hypothetical protein EOR67_32165, partial [Mesorhizobium sp.]|uniref:transposase n=1 Tax=Mesorhizobium sp. TaxID=1871066 RepID=UPI000FEA927A
RFTRPAGHNPRRKRTQNWIETGGNVTRSDGAGPTASTWRPPEKVHALVRDRYRSRESIEFLKLLDAYPPSTAIKLILDNHSAHISRETRTWLAAQPPGRFQFTFTPKHGSWLNLPEGFFSKSARSVLRHILWHRSTKQRIWQASRTSIAFPNPPDMLQFLETLNR